MSAFRLILVVLLIGLSVYTGVVVMEHGWNFFPVYFAAIGALGWQGQFNVDFTIFLVLMSLWVAWRHRWSAGGIALGLVSGIFGAVFLTVYLLVESRRATSIADLLTGDRR